LHRSIRGGLKSIRHAARSSVFPANFKSRRRKA
jgi:hypothetical protein